MPADFRGSSIAAIAGASGVCMYPRLAPTNVSRSFVVDRSAPAPANVGRSQFDAGCSVEE
jgi:hypothetical protein